MPDTADSFDIVIIGAGPAGIAAACAARTHNQSVLVIDNMPAAGGNIWRGAALHKKAGGASAWAQRFAACGAQVWHQSTLFAAPAPHTLEVETPTGTRSARYQKLILATGARELFLPFPGWTLPNVFGCGGIEAFAKGGWPVKGKHIVVAGTGPLLLAAAAQLKAEGAKVLLIAEQASLASLAQFALALPWIAPGKVFQAMALKASLLGVPLKTSTWVAAANGTARVDSVRLVNDEKTWEVPCDYLACAFSLTPSLEIPALLGCRISASAVQVNARMETSVPDVYSAGETNGIGGVDTSLLEGEIAGHAAVAALDPQSAAAAAVQKWSKRLPRANQFRQALKTAFMLRPELSKLARPDTLVCRCEDVPHKDLAAHATWRSAKLHTRCGMGPCQGRVCGGAVRTLFGWEGASVRPPVLPVRVECLASGRDINSV